ncbi:hypothetical protein [Streptomyces sp. NPDC000405]|uniref:hypothetical protein n=1 Tax=Streptomyces sp. NPDC000405 TaxID=3161033 RepID=UPI00398CA32C
MIFGASGLLGRSMMRAFEGWQVTGTSFHGKGPGLVAVDATSPYDVLGVLSHIGPNGVVNCVGERRPEAWAIAVAEGHRDADGGKGIGMTDAMNVALAAAYGTDLMFTTDRHFRMVRPLTGHPAFRLLPEDFQE